MERRWFRWGFLAEAVHEPFGDQDDAGTVVVDSDEPVAELVAALHAGGATTRSSSSEPTSPTWPRLADGSRRRTFGPPLAWILAYVVQEYARHAGHLDVARELIDQVVGE